MSQLFNPAGEDGSIPAKVWELLRRNPKLKQDFGMVRVDSRGRYFEEGGKDIPDAIDLVHWETLQLCWRTPEV